MATYFCQGCDQHKDDDVEMVMENQLCATCDELLQDELINQSLQLNGLPMESEQC